MSKEKLGAFADTRNRTLDDLEKRRRKLYNDLDYLKQEKISLLRTQTYSIEELSHEINRLNAKLEDVEEKTKQLHCNEKQMLQYILTFSELVKRAKEYYKNAIDTEKHEICSQAFSELYCYNGNLSKIKAKEGFEALFKRHKMHIGGAEFLFSELANIYFSIKSSMESPGSSICFDIVYYFIVRVFLLSQRLNATLKSSFKKLSYQPL